jgi:hypothetical protein
MLSITSVVFHAEHISPVDHTNGPGVGEVAVQLSYLDKYEIVKRTKCHVNYRVVGRATAFYA